MKICAMWRMPQGDNIVLLNYGIIVTNIHFGCDNLSNFLMDEKREQRNIHIKLMFKIDSCPFSYSDEVST